MVADTAQLTGRHPSRSTKERASATWGDDRAVPIHNAGPAHHPDRTFAMNASKTQESALADLRSELTRHANRLHHYERDHLEYGVPTDRDTPISRDPSGATLSELQNACTTLRARIAAYEGTVPIG
jgi:hypothetical protein